MSDDGTSTHIPAAAVDQEMVPAIDAAKTIVDGTISELGLLGSSLESLLESGGQKDAALNVRNRRAVTVENLRGLLRLFVQIATAYGHLAKMEVSLSFSIAALENTIDEVFPNLRRERAFQELRLLTDEAETIRATVSAVVLEFPARADQGGNASSGPATQTDNGSNRPI